VTDHDETPELGGKGRPTPSRKDAEAARRQERKPAMTRKQRMERERKARQEIRTKQREALNTGQGAYLPARDAGPVRAYVRDYVDRRRNFAEYLLPILIFMLLFNVVVGSTADNASLAGTVVAGLWMFTIIGTVLDEVTMVRGLKKGLRARFPDVSHKGTTSYAVLRSSQIRRLRLPKVAIERGGEFRSRY